MLLQMLHPSDLVVLGEVIPIWSDFWIAVAFAILMTWVQMPTIREDVAYYQPGNEEKRQEIVYEIGFMIVLDLLLLLLGFFIFVAILLLLFGWVVLRLTLKTRQRTFTNWLKSSVREKVSRFKRGLGWWGKLWQVLVPAGSKAA